MHGRTAQARGAVAPRPRGRSQEQSSTRLEPRTPTPGPCTRRASAGRPEGSFPASDACRAPGCARPSRSDTSAVRGRRSPSRGCGGPPWPSSRVRRQGSGCRSRSERTAGVGAGRHFICRRHAARGIHNGLGRRVVTRCPSQEDRVVFIIGIRKVGLARGACRGSLGVARVAHVPLPLLQGAYVGGSL